MYTVRHVHLYVLRQQELQCTSTCTCSHEVTNINWCWLLALTHSLKFGTSSYTENMWQNDNHSISFLMFMCTHFEQENIIHLRWPMHLLWHAWCSPGRWQAYYAIRAASFLSWLCQQSWVSPDTSSYQVPLQWLPPSPFPWMALQQRESECVLAASCWWLSESLPPSGPAVHDHSQTAQPACSLGPTHCRPRREQTLAHGNEQCLWEDLNKERIGKRMKINNQRT